IEVRWDRCATILPRGHGSRTWRSARLRGLHPGLAPDLWRRRVVALRPADKAGRPGDATAVVSRLQGDRYEVRGSDDVFAWGHRAPEPIRHAHKQGAIDFDPLPRVGSRTSGSLEWGGRQDTALDVGAVAEVGTRAPRVDSLQPRGENATLG